MREGQKELEEERTGERDRGSLHNYFFFPLPKQSFRRELRGGTGWGDGLMGCIRSTYGELGSISGLHRMRATRSQRRRVLLLAESMVSAGRRQLVRPGLV